MEQTTKHKDSEGEKIPTPLLVLGSPRRHGWIRLEILVRARPGRGPGSSGIGAFLIPQESCNCLNLWHLGVADCNATDGYIQLDRGLYQQCAAYWEQVQDRSSWEPEGLGPRRLWWLWLLLGLTTAGAMAALCAFRPAPGKQPPREEEAQLGEKPRAAAGRQRGAATDAARGREALPARSSPVSDLRRRDFFNTGSPDLGASFSSWIVFT